MIQDLTAIGLRNLNSQKFVNIKQHKISIHIPQEMVLTGDSKQRQEKRGMQSLLPEVSGYSICECCGCSFIDRPWDDNCGVCTKCNEIFVDIPPRLFHFEEPNRTRRIQDLLNRCY